MPTLTEPVTISGNTGGATRVELNGTSAGAIVNGLTISAGNSIIEGLVINRFSNDGILLMTNGGNTVRNCYVGTDVAGTLDQGNGGVGVRADSGSSNNTIGGTTAAERNLVSGNDQHGVGFFSATGTGNKVIGNFIGTDVTGTLALGNTNDGVVIFGSPGNTVGGTTAGERNLISGNNRYGVSITGSTGGNKISGNYIGTDVTGTLDLGNVNHGVLIQDAPNTTVGGTTAGERNIISGNNQDGVRINGTSATGNKVSGNYIGTDVTGTLDRGNSGIGVRVSGASNNTIGGTTAAERNLVSGNDQHGVGFFDAATGNKAIGNFIGTDVTGTLALGNTNDGVVIFNGASNNTVGGTNVGEGNLISNNRRHGVSATSTCIGNRILGNAIFNNASLGIDLGNNGVTTNDALDPDTGANKLQNFPVLDSLTTPGIVTGTLDSATGNSAYPVRLEFFANTALDASGNGEGEVFLGATTINAPGAFTFNYAPVAGKPVITSTATDANGNTSEFSTLACSPLSVLTVNHLGDLPDANPGDLVCSDSAGNCTLRAALMEANAIPACAPATINFSVTGVINLTSALPNIAVNLTMNGPGANLLTVRRDTGGDYRIFLSNGVGKDVAIHGLTISNGKTTGTGGGIAFFGTAASGSLTLTDCLISGNESPFGGGLFADGKVTISGCTISGNTASGQGGGINYQGFFSPNQTMRIINSTISSNTVTAGAGGNGAGILNAAFSGTNRLEVINSTIVNNIDLGTAPTGGIITGAQQIGSPPTATTILRNSIIANNTPSNVAIDNSGGSPGIVTSLGNNLTSDNGGGFLTGPGDLLNTNPLLAPLGNFGGPTLTHALLPGSPAINAGSNCVLTNTCANNNLGFNLTNDQRGVLRPQNTTVDIGAVESQGFTLAITGGNNQSAAINTAFPTALQVNLKEGAYNLPSAVITFTGPGGGAGINPTSIMATTDANGNASTSVTANSTTGGPYTVAATAIDVLTAAYFSLTNTLVPVTVNVPTGVSFTLNGTTYTGSQTINLAPGTYTLATTTPQSLGAGSRAVFSNWSDAGAISHSITVGASPLTITGNFITQYQLTTAASSGGTVTPATGTFYDAGTVVNVTATPNIGFTFTNWTGPVANANATATTVTMDAAKSITANFTNPPPTVVSILPASTNPTTAASVQFTVTFSESVTGVNANNFTLVPTSVAGTSITNVTGNGTTWTLTVSLGCGSDTLGLNMTNSTGVTDLGGAIVSNLTFVGGAYTINKTAPAMTTQPVAQIVGQGATASFTAAASGSPTPTVQWQVDSGSGFTNLTGATSTTLNVPNVTLAMNGFQYRAVFTNTCGTVNSDAALLTVNTIKVQIGDPLLCLNAGGLVGVTVTITNNNVAPVNANFTATLPTTLTGLPGTGLSSIMPGAVNVTAAAVTWAGTIPANTTVTLTYKAQVAAGTPANQPICVDSEVIFNNGPKAVVQECQVLNCPTQGVVKVSDQKPGAVLVFPYYISKAAEKKDTRLTISNLSDKPITAHVFFIDGTTCQQADQFLCLTPFASFTFKASEQDPEAVGWLLVVAVDANGRPTQQNGLIGNAFVNDGEYMDNYGAEAFHANSPLLAALTTDTATLFFDNQSYDAVPNQFALEIQSPLDAPNQRVVTVGLQGDLNQSTVTGAAQVGFGVVINGNEKPLGSFVSWLSGSCQAQATINANSPRVPGTLGGMIPKGHVGTMQFKIGAGVGLLMTPRTAPWPGIRTLHKIGSTATTLTIPLVAPSC